MLFFNFYLYIKTPITVIVHIAECMQIGIQNSYGLFLVPLLKIPLLVSGCIGLYQRKHWGYILNQIYLLVEAILWIVYTVIFLSVDPTLVPYSIGFLLAYIGMFVYFEKRKGIFRRTTDHDRSAGASPEEDRYTDRPKSFHAMLQARPVRFETHTPGKSSKRDISWSEKERNIAASLTMYGETAEKPKRFSVRIVLLAIFLAVLASGTIFLIIQDDSDVRNDTISVASLQTSSPTLTSSPAPTPTPISTPLRTAQHTALPLPDYAMQLHQLEQKYESYDFGTTTASILDGLQQQYADYDTLLNEIYQYLRSTMDENAFAALQRDESQWIREKEEKANRATSQFGNGSAGNLEYMSILVSETQNRCYYLLSFVQ